MNNNSSYSDIDIHVDTEYLEEYSDPKRNHFVFAYTVTMHNRSENPAKLLSRQLILTDGNGRVEKMQGQGVVGEHPCLEPGESFQYSSGAVLKTPVGCMQGAYQLITSKGQQFFSSLEPFLFAKPNEVH